MLAAMNFMPKTYVIEKLKSIALHNHIIICELIYAAYSSMLVMSVEDVTNREEGFERGGRCGMK